MLIALMGNDVVHLIRRRAETLIVATAHHGRTPSRPLTAKGILLSKGTSGVVPLGAIPANAEVASRTLTLRRMGRAVATRHSG